MAARFSANPSKEALADTIRGLYNFEIPEDVRHIYQTLPWPIATLLEYAQGSQNYAQIADDVQQGNYGDIEQWELAEGRWRDKGVTLHDLSYVISLNRPFDQNIDKVGFPLSYFSSSIHSVAPLSLLQTFHQLSDCRSEATHPYFITKLEELMDFVLLVFSMRSEVFDLITLNDFINMVSSVTRLRWIGASIIHSAWKHGSTDEFIKFVNFFIGNHKLRSFGGLDDVPEQVVEILATAFVNDPKQHGILNFLSYLAARKGVNPTIPHQLLSLERYNNSTSRQSALILQLTQQEWQHFPANQLAFHVFEVSREEPEVVDDVVQVIAINKISGAEVVYLPPLSRPQIDKNK